MGLFSNLTGGIAQLGKSLESTVASEEEDKKEGFTLSELSDQELTQEEKTKNALYLIVWAILLTLILYFLGPYLFNMSFAKVFGTKDITGIQAVAMALFIDLVL